MGSIRAPRRQVDVAHGGAVAPVRNRRSLRLPASLAALALPNYRRWAAADLVSNIGSWMSVAALGWLVYRTSGSAAALGSVIAVKQLPGVLLGLAGGALADRLEARRVLLVTQSANALASAVLAGAVLTGHVSLWQLYTFAALTGTIGVLDGPSFGRLLGEMLGPDHLRNGIALGSVTHSTGWVLGLALGSLVMAGPGAGAAFALDAASFAFVALTVLRLRTGLLRRLEPAESGPGAGGGGVRAGLRFVRGSRPLRTLLAVSAVTGAVGRHYQVTMAAMAHQAYAGGPDLYGRFFTCFSIGALVGAVAGARLPSLRLPVLLGAGALAAVVQCLAGTSPNAAAFATAMVGAAALNVVYDTAASATVQHLAPGALRGRVLAVQGLVSSLASMVGAPALGWASDALGVRVTLVGAGVLCLVALTVGALALAGGHRALLARLRLRPADRALPVT